MGDWECPCSYCNGGGAEEYAMYLESLAQAESPRYRWGVDFDPDTDAPFAASWPDPYGEWMRAADHDRIVAEAEARGWNAAVEAAVNAVDDVYPVSDQWGHHTLPHIDRRQASAAIAALRKPEVEG